MNKIKKGDEVIVITGKDKNRRGIVQAVLEGGKKLLIDGINSVKKHTRANPNTGDRGGIAIKTLPIDSSNVMLYNPNTEKGSRVGIRQLEDGRFVRYFKSDDELVDA